MALKFIIGSTGSGKSYKLYKEMIDTSIVNTDKNIVAVVPEQYSMETQKQILMLHPKGGSFNIEVTSFTRLAYMVLEEQGVMNYKVMDDLGKTLIVRKVLEDCREDLVIYKNKTSMPGFAEKVKQIISEMKQYGISQKTLFEMTKNAENRPALKHKLKDLEVIHQAFSDYIQDKMITTEEVLELFCKYIPLSDIIHNTYLYLDSFTGFTPIQYRVIELLMKYSKDITVAITLPENEMSFTGYNRFELFSLSKETITKLRELAIMNGIDIKRTVVAGEQRAPYRIKENKPLCHIEKNIFRNKKATKEDVQDSVFIFAANSLYSEVKFVVSQISKMIINDGYRYNDIAIITGDMEGYHRYIEEELDKQHIPCFVDHKRDISSNPFVESIIGAINVIEKDFSYDTVMHMLRLSVMDIDREYIDIFENYVRRSNRRGFRSYGRRWERLYKGVSEEQLDIVNSVRDSVYNNLSSLREILKDKNKNVLAYTKAVYQYMKRLNMQEKIYAYEKAFEKQGDLSKAKEYENTYAAIIEVLEKTVELMREEHLTLKDYSQILRTGFETVKVGIVPPGLDVLMVGDIERTRLKDTKKVLFFLGVNDGIIPNTGSVGGIITDTDREYLEGIHYQLAPTARDNVFKQRVYLYSLFAKPTEKLCICFSKSDNEGKTLRPSYVIDSLKKMFHNLNVTDIDDLNETIEDITNEEKALSYIASHIREYIDEGQDKLFEQLCSVMLNDKKYEKQTKNIIEGAFYFRRKKLLDKEIAKKLYENKENIGITRIEKFASCAYKQFLASGLKLGERAEFEIAGYDLGNLYHNAINEFFTQVDSRGIDWSYLDQDTGAEIINKCVDKVIEEYDNDALEKTARNLFIKSQVRETVSKTAGMLIKHIRSGKFKPERYEMKVMHGRIDRVDTFEKGDNIYVKVIDYKSGQTAFNITDTFFGMQMQLMVYLKDAISNIAKENPDKQVLPAAGLYFHIHNPYVERPDFEKVKEAFRKKNTDSVLTDEEIVLKYIENIKDSQYQMSGLVNADYDVITAVDKDLENASYKSNIVKVSTTKEGISKTSTIIDSDNYSKFIDYVSDMAEDMKGRILEGDIVLNPVESACKYCKFNAICGFDRRLGDRFREIENVDLEYVISKLNKDGKLSDEVEIDA